MLSVVVSDNVCMSERGQNGEFGVKLFPFFLRHAQVIDLLATENLAILLPAHLSDDTEGTMS